MDTAHYSQRSNQPVADIVLSDRDVSDTARLLNLLTGTKRAPVALMATSFEGEESPPVEAESNRHSALVGAAKQALISRRARGQFLDPSMFGEPGWDMLLALYITEKTEARNSIARLTEFSGATPTTALRWISHLEGLGLVRRVPHPTDLRTTFIELTAEARHALMGYFYRVDAMGIAA